MPVNLSRHSELSKAYAAYQRQLSAYISGNRLYWSEKLQAGGTFSNFEAGLMYVLKGGRSSLATGCVQLQQKTFATISPLVPDDWVVRRWRVGGAVGHSAVCVYKRGDSPHDGYIFDPWLAQAPLVYTYDEWERATRVHAIMGKARPQ